MAKEKNGRTIAPALSGSLFQGVDGALPDGNLGPRVAETFPTYNPLTHQHLEKMREGIMGKSSITPDAGKNVSDLKITNPGDLPLPLPSLSRNISDGSRLLYSGGRAL